MTDNPIRQGFASTRSPWGAFDVIVVPDDDVDARSLGIPDDVLPLATQDHPVMDGKTMYVRETLWGRIKSEFAALGQRH